MNTPALIRWFVTVGAPSWNCEPDGPAGAWCQGCFLATNAIDAAQKARRAFGERIGGLAEPVTIHVHRLDEADRFELRTTLTRVEGHDR